MTDERHLLTASQLRMARAALRLSVAQVASQSGVSQVTIHKLEKGEGSALLSTIAKLEDFYRSQGISFCPGDNGGAGVRVRDREGPRGSGR